uniref:Uncharacterized protein n=1 Tax=Ciona intestinalis TaxID=7719 RepID=H2XXR1_CIOIN
MNVTYLSSRYGATRVVITQTFCFIHLVLSYKLPRM